MAKRGLLTGIALVAAAMVAGPHAPAAEPTEAEPAVLVGAGGIAACDSPGDEATAALLDAIPGTVFTAGDNAYNDGTPAQFAKCYDPTWGRHKDRTKPTPGNHDYSTTAAEGYYGYFGAAAGNPAQGWYSYDLGSWHVVVLNSNCPRVGGCGAGSPQERWLRADLAAHPQACTAAFFHHPRFSSDNIDGSLKSVAPFWDALYDYGAEIVVNGHARVYERFDPQTPSGTADPSGLREFNVGTGGRGHAHFGKALPNSVVRNDDSWGVLKLSLEAGRYGWEFVPVAGKTFTDRGTGTCHGEDTTPPDPDDPPSPPAPPAPTTIRTFLADADAGVAKTNPATNYGPATKLETDASPGEESYLRFQVTGLTGAVRRAKMRLFVTNGSPDGPTLYPTATNWSEGTINWSNRPARSGPAVADIATAKAGTWVEFDISGLVTGDGTYGCNLSPTSDDGTDFNSSEASSNQPELVIEADAGPNPPTDPPVEPDPPVDPGPPVDPAPPVEPEPPVEPAPAPPPAVTTVKFGANADARVVQQSPSTNFGHRGLEADSSPVVESYLRFQVAGVNGTVRRVVLRLFVTNGSNDGPALSPTAANWSESAITWNNRPARSGPAAADLRATPAGTWVEYDLTGLVTANGTHSFNLRGTGNDGAGFNSREAPAGKRPELIITTG